LLTLQTRELVWGQHAGSAPRITLLSTKYKENIV
jgi:hypothetical protein